MVDGAIGAIWRIEFPKLIASLVRVTGDVDLAEELAQDAFVAALEQWPCEGIPEQPGAWLMTIARRRAIDRIRRDKRYRDIQRRLATDTPVGVRVPAEVQVEDDVLRLIFMSCHPVLSAESRAAITLRLVCGLTTEEIGRAFLTAEATIAQRITRAKRTLAKERVDFELPGPDELASRLASVLEVIYLLFNEGYAATAGEDWTRPTLCQEAIRLARMLSAMMAREADVHALQALLELQASRLGARLDEDGRPILLEDQDRSRWDHLLIRRGLDALARAESLASSPTAYTIQAAIGACHARARRAEETDWGRIAELYVTLLEITPSPIVALNHAVAVAMAEGAEAGLALVEGLAGEPSLAGYHLLASVRGELLRRVGRYGEAREQFELAAGLTRNEREKGLLLERARGCGAAGRGC